jgi:hypothetical protein
MPSALLKDLSVQRRAVKRFLGKALMLGALFLALDRLAGWLFLRGLDRYFGLDVPAQVLCVGHSHTVLGIDKVALEQALGVPVAKFALAGANTSDRRLMIQYYLKRQPNSVRAVVYDVDAHTFTDSGLSANSYRLLFPFLGDPEIRDYVRRNCPSRVEFQLRRLFWTARYDESMLALVGRGYLRTWSNFKFGRVDPARLQQEIQQGRFRRIAFDQDNLSQFKQTAELVTTHHARFCLAYVPTVDLLNRAEPEQFQHCLSIFTGFASTNHDILFLNYNPGFEARYELFRDPIHLNREGQKEFTRQIAGDLKRILGPQSTAKLSVQNTSEAK